MSPTSRLSPALRAVAFVAALVVAPAFAYPGMSAAPKGAQAPKVAPAKPADGTDGLAMEARDLYAAVVHVEARAVENARSNATLGREREGTGTVIAKGGVILTIGYLVIEADEIKVTDSEGRAYPARMVAYDHATGLALLKTSTPFDVRPVPLGNSGKLADMEPVLVAGWGGIPDTALAYVVSRRPFTGSWEYMLDEAIFTVPPTTGWSGAALVDRRGTIVGVGSLIVRDAGEEDERVPGNMFVPVDALKPILADLVKTGRRAGPARPWLGVAADEVQGRLVVTRVSADGPADAAGLEAGDIILAVRGEPVRTQAEFYRKVWGGGPAGSQVPLRVLQGVEVRELQLKSIDRVDYFRPKTMH